MHHMAIIPRYKGLNQYAFPLPAHNQPVNTFSTSTSIMQTLHTHQFLKPDHISAQDKVIDPESSIKINYFWCCFPLADNKANPKMVAAIFTGYETINLCKCLRHIHIFNVKVTLLHFFQINTHESLNDSLY